MPATYVLDSSFVNYAGHGLREASNLATPGVPAVVRTVIQPPSAFQCIVLGWSFLALANSTALLPGWLAGVRVRQSCCADGVLIPARLSRRRREWIAGFLLSLPFCCRDFRWVFPFGLPKLALGWRYLPRLDVV
jgi:hypothetical protein